MKKINLGDSIYKDPKKQVSNVTQFMIEITSFVRKCLNHVTYQAKVVTSSPLILFSFDL
jgi:hypothetical protein